MLEQTNLGDVRAFQRKYGIPVVDAPQPLTKELSDFRVGFMQEELDEYKAAVADGDLTKQADALVDLVYVALGTALSQGFPWQVIWNLVHEANMRKVRVESPDQGRNQFDVVKPEGWESPNPGITRTLLRAILAGSSRDETRSKATGKHVNSPLIALLENSGYTPQNPDADPATMVAAELATDQGDGFTQRLEANRVETDGGVTRILPR
jgi:predicted HAD superfamily Cof-like phosphohydrolase